MTMKKPTIPELIEDTEGFLTTLRDAINAAADGAFQVESAECILKLSNGSIISIRRYDHDLTTPKQSEYFNVTQKHSDEVN